MIGTGSRAAGLLGGLALACVLGLWIGSQRSSLVAASADARIIEAFWSDEALEVRTVQQAIGHGDWVLHSYPSYPHLYFNVALGALRAGRRLAPTAQQTVLVLRSVSLASAAGTLLLVWWWTRRTAGPAASWLSLALLASHPLFYRFATLAHPDQLQLLLLTAGLTAVLASPTESERSGIAPVGALAASALAGLAFATKYFGLPLLGVVVLLILMHPPPGLRAWPKTIWALRSGAATAAAAALVTAWVVTPDLVAPFVPNWDTFGPRLLPFITHVRWGAALTGLALTGMAAASAPWRWLRGHPLHTAVVPLAAGCAVAFAAAFVISSPYSLWRLAFARGLVYEAIKGVPYSRLATLLQLGNSIGWPLAFAGSLAIAAALVRSPRTPAIRALVAWEAVLLWVLLRSGSAIEPHYVLPLLPALAVGLAGALPQRALVGEAASRPRTTATTVVVVLLVLGIAAGQVVTLMAERTAWIEREARSPVTAVGRWLACRVPPSTTIVADHESYVPASFSSVFFMWEGSLDLLTDTRPGVVVVHRLRNAASTAPFYDCLRRGSCGYTRVLTLGWFDVYATPELRESIEARDRECPDAAALLTPDGR